jgi:hypothetical protein
VEFPSVLALVAAGRGRPSSLSWRSGRRRSPSAPCPRSAEGTSPPGTRPDPPSPPRPPPPCSMPWLRPGRTLRQARWLASA